MSLTDFSRNKVQDNLYGATAFTPPANYWLALSSSNISTSGSNATEPVGNGYARVQIPNSKSYWTNSTGGCIVNSASIVFVMSSGSWPTINTLALFDASTSGSVWAYTTLSTPIVVQTNTTVSFSASGLTFSQS